MTEELVENDASAVAALVPHTGKTKNLQLQWLRALAALMVVVFHASAYAAALHVNDSFLTVLDGRLGVTGVSLFFAISGYLMATAIQVQEPFTFLSHRIIRIYPAFLIAAALYCAAEYLLHQPLRINLLGLSLFPVGTTAKYPLRVEWTLVFELTFYVGLFFVALAGQARRLPYIAAAWLVVLAGFSWFRPDTGDLVYPVQTILTVCENVGMAGGLLIPTILRLKLPPPLLVLVGVMAWPVYSLDTAAFNNESLRWLFGIAAVLVLAGTIGLSARWPGFGQNKAGRGLAKFGDYSYALYLIHGPILYSLYSVVHGLAFPVLWAIGIMSTFIGAILLGMVDMALYRRSKAWLKTVPRLRLRIAISLYLLLFLGVAIPSGWRMHVITGRMDTARGLATALAAGGPVATVEQVRQAAAAAGFTESATLQGAIEKAATDADGLEITGWAVDGRKAKGVASVALFQNGSLLDVGVTSFTLAPIQQRFATRAKAGFAFTLTGKCDAAAIVVGVVLASDRSYAVLAGQPVPDCGRAP